MGSESVFTEYSVKRHGQHIVPIIEHEHVLHGIRSEYLMLVKKMSQNFRVPSLWRIHDGHYGQFRSWSGFEMGKEWLLQTVVGLASLNPNKAPNKQPTAQ